MPSKWLQNSNATTNSCQRRFYRGKFGEMATTSTFPCKRGGVMICATAMAGHCPPLMGGETPLVSMCHTETELCNLTPNVRIFPLDKVSREGRRF